VVISIDRKRKFTKFNYIFMTKTLNKLGSQGKYRSIIKVIYDKPMAIIIFSGRKAKMFLSKIWNKVRMPSFTTFIQPSAGIPRQSN
jgi:hypothetical protein